MNGQWIGSRAIRTNWATRKPPAPNQKDGTMFFSVFFGFANLANLTETAEHYSHEYYNLIFFCFFTVLYTNRYAHMVSA